MTGCPNCGAKIAPVDEQCWRCGSSVDGDDSAGRETDSPGADPGSPAQPTDTWQERDGERDGHQSTDAQNGPDQRDPRQHTRPAYEREPRESGRADQRGNGGSATTGDQGEPGYGRHQTVPAHEQVPGGERGPPAGQGSGGQQQPHDGQPAQPLETDLETETAGTERPLGRRGLLVGGGILAAAAVGGWAVFRDSLGIEPGDGFETATPVRAGEYGPFEIVAGERQYFRVDLQRGEQLTAGIAFEDAAGDLDLAVYGPGADDDDEQPIAEARSTSNDEQAVVTARESGTHYVVPYGYGDNGNEYELSVEVTEPKTPGNTVAAARPVSPGTYGPYQVGSDEEHYFAVDLNQGDQLRVTITFAHREADLDLVVLDPSRTEIGSAASTSDNETVTVRASTDGTHTIRVFPFEDGSTSYELSVSTE